MQYKLPNGDVFEVNRDVGGRGRYKLNDKPLTGVTTILNEQAKPYLIVWAAKEAYKDCVGRTKAQIEEIIKTANYAHTKKSDTAKDIGTEAHDAVEVFIKHNIATGEYLNEYKFTTEQAKVSAHRFFKWAMDNKVKFLESEISVYHGELWYGGSFDFICEIDGKIYLGDFKTSSKIDNTYYAQGTAYMKAVNYIREISGNIKYDFAGTIIVKSTKEAGDKTYLSTNEYGTRKLVTTPAFEVGMSTNIEADWQYFMCLLGIYRYNKNKEIRDFKILPDAPEFYEEEL